MWEERSAESMVAKLKLQKNQIRKSPRATWHAHSHHVSVTAESNFKFMNLFLPADKTLYARPTGIIFCIPNYNLTPAHRCPSKYAKYKALVANVLMYYG